MFSDCVCVSGVVWCEGGCHYGTHYMVHAIFELPSPPVVCYFIERKVEAHRVLLGFVNSSC